MLLNSIVARTGFRLALVTNRWWNFICDSNSIRPSFFHRFCFLAHFFSFPIENNLPKKTETFSIVLFFLWQFFYAASPPQFERKLKRNKKCSKRKGGKTWMKCAINDYGTVRIIQAKVWKLHDERSSGVQVNKRQKKKQREWSRMKETYNKRNARIRRSWIFTASTSRAPSQNAKCQQL